MNVNKKRNLIALLLSALGTLFVIYYIFRASTNVIASDYVRIVHYYLDDVYDLHYLLSWEAISRIPVTFLCRIINKEVCHYSVFFDKVLGVFGLFLFNLVTVKYILNTFKAKIVKIITSVIVTFISFSLMAWEMILNGTGYAHFLTVGLIALVFYLFDRIIKRTKTIMTLENLDSSDLKYYGNAKENNRLSNMVALIDTSQLQRKNLRAHFFVYLLIVATSVLFAGSYSVSFLCTMILFSFIEIFAFIIIRNRFNRGEIDSFDSDRELYAEFREQYNSQEIRNFGSFKGEKYSTVNNESTFKIFFKFLIIIIISIICLACYFKSNSTGEPLVPVGTYDISLLDALKDDPKFPIRFFLKSFASCILGVETFNYAISFKTIDENMIFFVGTIYLLIIIVTLVNLIIRIVHKDNSKINIFDINSYRNIFPYLFIVIGLANFALIFLARYKFLRDDYGMSSRYAIQYMFFTIGIIILNAFFVDDVVANKKYYKVDKKELNLSKGYLKRREKLIEEGKIKLADPKVSIFYIITSGISVFCIVVLFFGHLTTTMDEVFKADYRKIAYQNLEKVAKDYKNVSDKDLETAFEYHRDVNHIKHALSTLESQNLNVFHK